jgi:hypothetical protein
MFRPFFTTIFRRSSAVLCAVTIPPADLRSLSLYCYTVCGCMCMSSVRVWCSCLLMICLWTHVSSQADHQQTRTHVSSQADRQQTRTPNTHKWHTHAATYCAIIQTQRTQISGRNSNGTKQSGGPPWRWSWKKTETCRGFILTNTFLTFCWFYMLKWVCFKVWIVHELDCKTSVATCTVQH